MARTIDPNGAARGAHLAAGVVDADNPEVGLSR